jgi:hypothetical protein
MDYTFLWNSTLHVVRIPDELAEVAASEETKWLYVQHKIVSGSHVVAMVRVMEALHPGLSFSTEVGPSYAKPLLLSSFYDMSLPSGSLTDHKSSHRPSTSSSKRGGTRGGAGNGGPGRPAPQRPTSTALPARGPFEAGSIHTPRQQPTKRPATQGTGGWQGSKTTTPVAH